MVDQNVNDNQIVFSRPKARESVTQAVTDLPSLVDQQNNNKKDLPRTDVDLIKVTSDRIPAQFRRDWRNGHIVVAKDLSLLWADDGSPIKSQRGYICKAKAEPKTGYHGKNYILGVKQNFMHSGLVYRRYGPWIILYYYEDGRAVPFKNLEKLGFDDCRLGDAYVPLAVLYNELIKHLPTLDQWEKVAEGPEWFSGKWIKWGKYLKQDEMHWQNPLYEGHSVPSDKFALKRIVDLRREQKRKNKMGGARRLDNNKNRSKSPNTHKLRQSTRKSWNIRWQAKNPASVRKNNNNNPNEDDEKKSMLDNNTTPLGPVPDLVDKPPRENKKVKNTNKEEAVYNNNNNNQVKVTAAVYKKKGSNKGLNTKTANL